jgi:ribonuclease HI
MKSRVAKELSGARVVPGFSTGEDKMEVTVYIDGSSQGNPGPAGISALIYNGKGELEKKISEYIGVTTNNVAEYTALIYALQGALILGIKRMTIFTDSELVSKQLEGSYRVKDNDLKRLYKQVKHLLTGFEKVNIEHISREENKEADRVARRVTKEGK